MSCCNVDKCDCSRSAILMFLLGGTDACSSSIGEILVEVAVMVLY